MSYLTGEELLAGSTVTHDVAIPLQLLDGTNVPAENGSPKVKLRPLTVRDIQRVTRAAKDNDSLLSVLMLKEAMVEPALNLEQVHSLQGGLARFLLDELNRISGLCMDQDNLNDAVQAPLARACFILAREFGWSPQEVGDLTMGQILLYLEMLGQPESGATV
jgi:hypothetical protein